MHEPLEVQGFLAAIGNCFDKVNPFEEEGFLQAEYVSMGAEYVLVRCTCF